MKVRTAAYCIRSLPSGSLLALRVALTGATLALVASMGIEGVQQGAEQRSEQATWASLSDSQRQTLAPLKAKWPMMDDARRHKWLHIAARVKAMSPQTQRRLNERMAAWAALTPRERSRARLSYWQAAAQFDQAQRAAQWARYRGAPASKRPHAPSGSSLLPVSPVTVLAEPGATTVLITMLPAPQSRKSPTRPR